MYTSRPICTALFDLFKIGPGPSSSHTIGPMRAGSDFYRLCHELPADVRCKGANFRVRLFGSLSATGVGHGTNAAVVAGLMGNSPQHCPPSLLRELSANPAAVHDVPLSCVDIPICVNDVVNDAVQHSFPYSNTLVIALLDISGAVLLEREYYSTGGGFIQWKGEAGSEEERGKPVHEYATMDDLLEIMQRTGLALHEVILDNEMAITGARRPTILAHMDDLLARMEDSVRRGLDLEGPLPGPLGVVRKARELKERSRRLGHSGERFLASLNAYALAASEENAAGGVIVTAPTCGASGVIPALVYAMRHNNSINDRALREGLMAAAAVGFLAKHNASIAGAEVGCQGEVGVASAMGAALYMNALGNCPERVGNAAEVALEHHLGLTCDPVEGYVQIPCIERNAMGAVKAYNAAILMQCLPAHSQRVTLDACIAAMAEIGRDMNSKFKETSLGGLAMSAVEC